MKIKKLNNDNLIQSLKVVPTLRIAIMFIVAILSFVTAGTAPSFLALLFITMLFVLQIVFTYKYLNENVPQNTKKSLLSYIPAVVLFIIFTIFNLFTNHDVIYSVIISLSLSLLLLPINKSYFNIISFVLHKQDIKYSSGVESCDEIIRCDKIIYSTEHFFTGNRYISNLSTAYSQYDNKTEFNNINNDYAVGILKEFVSILDLKSDEFSAINTNTDIEYNYYIEPKTTNGITYAVLNNKDGYRVVACGDFSVIKTYCNGYADKDALSDLSEDKNELNSSVASYSKKCSAILSFAFCDLDKFDSVDAIKDMIYIGSMGIKKELTNTAYNLIEDIASKDYSTKIICGEDDIKDIAMLLDFNNLEYIISDYCIYISDCVFDESEAAIYNQDMIKYKSNTFTGTNILFSKLKESVGTILNNSDGIEQNTNVLSHSIIVTFSLAAALIPNNVMQPYIVVILSCIIEMISMFAVRNNKTSNAVSLANTFIISLSALSVFFAGRFFVDAPLSKFDFESVNIARTMLIIFYILLAPLYDSLTIFSEPKKYLNNIIVIIVSVFVVLVLNVPFVCGILGLKHLGFEATKYVILFVLIPVLINIILTIVNNRKVNKNGK